MIYKNIILENNFNKKCKTEIDILHEYYQNEISLLKDINNYNNEKYVTESCDLDVLEENFLENIANKIQEMLSRFLEWLKSLWDSFKGLFDNKVSNETKKVEKAEKEIKNINKSDLPEEKKEIKKQEVVSKIAIKALPYDPDRVETKQQDFKYAKTKNFRDYKFEFDMLLPNHIENFLFSESRFILNKILDYIKNNKLDNIDKFVNSDLFSISPSLESYKKLWYKEGFGSNSRRFDNAEELLRYYKKRLEKYDEIKKIIEKRKREVEQDVKKIQQTVNSVSRNTTQDNLKILYSLVNKYRSLAQEEINTACRFITTISPKFKVKK